MTNQLRLVLGFSLLSFMACDDDDDDDDAPPEYRSGVDSSSSSSTPVSSLDESDQRAICESLNSYVDSYVDVDQAAYVACLPQALVLGANTADCERRLDNCMALAPTTRVSVEVQTEGVAGCLNDVRRCNATVAELEGCVNLNVGIFYDILDWSCARIDDPNGRSDAEDAMRNVSACTSGNASCGEVTRIRPD